MKKKYDSVLYLVLAVLFAASVLAAAYPSKRDGTIVVEAISEGKSTVLGSLGEMGGSLITFGKPGNFNEIAIGEGVRMVSADCPGGDCLRAGEIKKSGELIICVPNKLLIRLVSSQKGGIDAVSH